MVGIRVVNFAATLPLRDPRLLPEGAAAEAVNTRLSGGALDGVCRRRTLKTLAGSTIHVYRIPTSEDIYDLDDSYWMEFLDRNTNVVRSPIVNDSFERYYWASPSTGFRYAPKADILTSGAAAGKPVGIAGPPAGSPMSIGVTGGSQSNVTRAYVVTFVSEFGEESQPSAPVYHTGKPDGTWNLTSIPVATNVEGTPTYTEKFIYRTVTASNGVTTFFKVAEIGPAAVNYNDNFDDIDITGNAQLESTSWARPPNGIRGLVAMPNGILVGWTNTNNGNTLYFSENYRPHAWPAEYALTVQHPIVGLAVIGNTCVVMTEGNPATVTGVNAANMVLATSDAPLPCLSRMSIMSAPEGVYYASAAGLVYFNGSRFQVITDALIGREKWQRLYVPSTIHATRAYGCYVGLRSIDDTRRGFILPSAAPDGGAQFGVVDLDDIGGAPTIGIDAWSGRNWIIIANTLYEWLPSDTRREKYRWRSKEFQLVEPVNLSCAQVRFRPFEFTPDGGEVLLRMRVLADGVVRYNQDITTRSGQTIQLPTGFRSDVWQVELEGAVIVTECVLGQTVDDLRKV